MKACKWHMQQRFLHETQHPQLRGATGDDVDFESLDKGTLHKMDNALLKILLLAADENRENSRPLTANAILLPALSRQALEEEDEIQRHQGELVKEPVVTMDDLYAKESGHLSLAGSSSTVERLHELKIKMAVEAYESSHAWKVYRGAEAHGRDEDAFSWVIGSLSDDLSAPTLGWRAFTAPEPVPVLRYYTHEYSEAYALLYSNRSEARMKLQDFRGAADDGDEALKFLKALAALKTILRLARALQAMQRMSEAMRLLHHERRNYPECQEMQRLAESTRLALRSLGRGTPSQSRSGREELGMDSQHGRKLMEYIAFISESLEHEINSMKGRHGGTTVLPNAFMALLSKLEYVMLKAEEVEEEVLDSLQALLQTNGVLRHLLNILEAQWKMNMEGKFVDLYKLPGALEVAFVTALICQGNEANLRYLASEAHIMWALLGRNQTLEVIQSNSVVERAAFYLSQAVQSSAEDDCLFGPDSPHVSLACKEQAALLLLDLLAQGGRLKKRALRGILPQLAGRRGSGGFFHRTQAAAAARTLGELVAKNAVDDPQLVDDPEASAEVTHLLLAIQQMVQEDTGDTKADLTEWKGSRYCVILLEVVSKVLEQKLLKDRELERGAYEAAFKEGQGLEIMVPLIRANPEVALHALRCVCTMAQTYLENVELIIRLGTIQALLNLESASMASMMETLKIPDGRRYAARILMQCSASKDFMDVIGTQQERSFTLQLVKLGIQLWDDGISSAEAFQDIMLKHT
eukprot:symbB.v1.2.001940.t1/scaffold55.1/size374282/22